MPKTLFEDDGDGQVDFSINKSYADKYDSWRRKEELQKFKDRYGKDALDRSEEENCSTSSEDDDSDEEITEIFDKEFYRTLSSLKARDPKIYDKSTTFFEKTDQSSKKDEQRSAKKKKPMFLRDYERKLILEKGGILSDEETDTDLKDERMHSPSYFEEQEAIRESFKAAMDKIKDDEDEGIGGLFSKKIKSSEEKAVEEDEYAAWLQGRKDELKNEEEEKGLSVLRSYWTDPTLDSGEAFLRDYILQKKFITKGKIKKTKKDYSYIESDNESLEKEERDIEHIEEFEQKFNFRFEEPDQDFIKRYPRTIDSTLRKKDDRRKQKREELRSRKDAEMQRHKEELRKAKELKRKDIEERLQKLCRITGNPEIGFKGEDLEADFDPQEHDRRMNELFSQDSFYDTAEEEKPEFPSLDEELDIEKWDNWGVGERGADVTDRQVYEDGLHAEDPNFNMDCDYDPKAEFQQSMIAASQGRKTKKERGRRQRGINSKLAKGLVCKKPIFDPLDFLSKAHLDKGSASEAFEKYVDEYYGLDFEDVIGGDLPCRFKYRKVTPNDYGLSVEEILNADDKELNRWCSLKKALKIKPEENEKYDLQAYRKKGSNIKLKKKIFASIYSEPTEGSEEIGFQAPKKKRKVVIGDSNMQSKNEENPVDYSDTMVNVEAYLDVDMDNALEEKTEISFEENEAKSSVCDAKDRGNLMKKVRKRKRNKLGKGMRYLKKEGKFSDGWKMCDNNPEIGGERKKEKKPPSTRDSYLSGIPNSRLKAYGINPKRFKNKLKYKQSE